MWVNEKLKEPLSDKDVQKSLDRKNDEVAVLNNEDAGAKQIEAAAQAVEKAEHDVKTTAAVTREEYMCCSPLVRC